MPLTSKGQSDRVVLIYSLPYLPQALESDTLGKLEEVRYVTWLVTVHVFICSYR